MPLLRRRGEVPEYTLVVHEEKDQEDIHHHQSCNRCYPLQETEGEKGLYDFALGGRGGAQDLGFVGFAAGEGVRGGVGTSGGVARDAAGPGGPCRLRIVSFYRGRGTARYGQGNGEGASCRDVVGGHVVDLERAVCVGGRLEDWSERKVKVGPRWRIWWWSCTVRSSGAGSCVRISINAGGQGDNQGMDVLLFVVEGEDCTVQYCTCCTVLECRFGEIKVYLPSVVGVYYGVYVRAA